MKKIIISDCDGILTNGKSIYTYNGKTAKVYGSFDTEAIRTAHDLGWEFLFVSDDRHGWNITKARLDDYKEKGLCEYQIASPEEREELVKEYQNKGYYVVFVGDSISDLKAGLTANRFCTTSNAWDSVQDMCDFISEREGGNGGFAEIIYDCLDEIE